ncbi:MAG TPA: hypothetical protein VFW38_13140 [Solirubrobacteraceae bacterium]|nr:hypothetical protein [Solirubrobacteraceae bacterium]
MQDETPAATQPTATRPPAAFDDGLVEHELPPRPRHRLLGVGANPLGVALLCALLTVCGFIGGVFVEKGQGQSSAASTGTGALASRLAALRGGGSSGSRGGSGSRGSSSLAQLAGAAGSGGAGPTIGQVAYVSGDSLYVTSFEGNTIKVTASAGASVTRTVKSALKSIHPGETVIVTGSNGSDGTIHAQSIRASEASAGGGLGGVLFGGANGGGAGPRASRRESSEGPALFGK